MKILHTSVAALLLCLCLQRPASAWVTATRSPDWSFDAVIGLGVGSLVALTSSAVVIGGNSYGLFTGEKPHLAWRLFGYLAGAADWALAVTWWSAVDDDEANLRAGLPLAITGAVTLGLAIAGELRHERQRWLVAPMLGTTVSPAAGLSTIIVW